MSSAEVASSNIRIFGAFRMTRAIATRCFSPPDNLRPRSPTVALVAVGQRGDEIVDVRQPRRLLDRRGRRPGPAIGDVVEDRVVEQHRVLRHDADRAPQAVLGHVAEILAVDLDRAVIDVVEAEQQPRDRRFAGAARADDRDRAAGRHAEIDTSLQDRAARVVAEIDMVERRSRRAADRSAGAPGWSSISGLTAISSRIICSRSVSDCLMLR